MNESTNMIGKLSVQYSNRPEIQALLSLVPGWSSVDTLLQKRADEIKSDRLKVFFDELAQGKQDLTEDLIQSDNFLHAYFSTLRAAMNCRQREKILNFARLLNSSLDSTLQVGEDEYEELLILLDEVSLREFAILCDLRKCELSNPRKKGENALQNSWRYWKDFREGTIETYNIPNESFNAFMARLERTGLYLRITGNFLDYTGDIGTTTPLLSRVIALVNENKTYE